MGTGEDGKGRRGGSGQDGEGEERGTGAVGELSKLKLYENALQKRTTQLILNYNVKSLSGITLHRWTIQLPKENHSARHKMFPLSYCWGH